MKKTILLICIFIQITAHNFPTWELQSLDQDAYIVTIPSPQDIDPKQAWDCFTFCTLYFPNLLEKAHKEGKKLFLALPNNYHHAKTTSADAPLQEGARVALAWASTYYRFYNTDVTILPFSSATAQDFIQATHTLLHRKSHEKETIQQRILHLDTVKNVPEPTELSLYKKTLFYQSPKPTTLINPELPQKHVDQKRVVITGGAGFIGSHLTEQYLADGHQVIVLDDFSCCTQDAMRALHNPHLSWHQFDVTDPFIISGPIDTVIHLASHPSPLDYYHNPIETLRTGLHGTKNALELARIKNARFIMGSTSEVYGDPHVHPQPESYEGNVDAIGKRSQYDQSKRGAETWCKYYFDTYNLDIRIMRIFNTYGPRMRLGDGRVVTNFIKAVLEQSDITIYGSGNQTRSFSYVKDTVEGIYRVAQSDIISQRQSLDERIFNVGNSGEFTINDVAEKVNFLSKKYTGSPTNITHIPQFDMSDPKIRCPNLAHIKTSVNYEPRINFQEGLEKTFLYFFHHN